jgi:Putative restriction endonuclease
MRTVILGEPPKELEALIESRRATGADLYDEVWEGDYHMNPAPRKRHALLEHRLARVLGPLADRAHLYGSGIFNLGEPEDFRVPDGGLHRDESDEVFLSTAAVVVEIVSSGDEPWEKLPFYAAHGVDEVVVADPSDRSLVWMERDGDGYRPVERSDLLDIDIADIAAQIDWPPIDD